jgi:hypothetical protein
MEMAGRERGMNSILCIIFQKPFLQFFVYALYLFQSSIFIL